VKAIGSLPQTLSRRSALIFGGAASVLLPWIVILALTQPDRGTADHIQPLRLVLVGSIVVLGLFLVIRPPADRLSAALLGGAVTGLALSAVWFDLITRVGLPTIRFVIRIGVYAGFVAVCGAILALLCLYGPRSAWAGPRALLFVALALLALEATSILSAHRSVLRVDNVDLAWVGLDICEFAGLATLAITLRTRRRFVVFIGPATGALLFSDAAINVITSGGVMSMLAALAMALVEIGLGVLAVVVAAREATRIRRSAETDKGLPDLDATPDFDASPMPDLRPASTAARGRSPRCGV
jgi:hypothetical protein